MSKHDWIDIGAKTIIVIGAIIILYITVTL